MPPKMVAIGNFLATNANKKEEDDFCGWIMDVETVQLVDPLMLLSHNCADSSFMFL